MNYRRQRERALRALSDGLGRLPAGVTEVDNLIDSAVRQAWKMKPGKLYGFLPAETEKPAPQPPKEIRLAVPFWKQTDNAREPHRTCFSSSMAMIVEFFSPDKLKGDDDYIKTVFAIGDTTNPAVQVKALERYGIVGQFRQNLDFADLDSELAQGFPVGIGILHRGTPDKPTGGHWIVVIGKTADGLAYYCHDPYGSIANGYQGDADQGEGIQYSVNMLRKRWTVEGKNSGWGMICRKKSDGGGANVPPASQLLNKLLEGGSDSPIAIAVGVSEGTRTKNGEKTKAWYGHQDPGNQKRNVGSFSWQHGGTPEDADIAQLKKIKDRLMPAFLESVGLSLPDSELTKLFAIACDLFTQSEAAVLLQGGLLDQYRANLPQISPKTVGFSTLVDWRVQSYRDPRTGKLDAPGFNNDLDRLRGDQRRRTHEVFLVLDLKE